MVGLVLLTKSSWWLLAGRSRDPCNVWSAFCPDAQSWCTAVINSCTPAGFLTQKAASMATETAYWRLLMNPVTAEYQVHTLF
jgi:hypothetical protein